MVQFLQGLNYDIANVVELQHYRIKRYDVYGNESTQATKEKEHHH